MIQNPSSSMSTNAAVLENVSKDYFKKDGSLMVSALRDVSLDIPKGQYMGIMGASGSGKSTLMNILGCLDRPTRGRYLLNGTAIEAMEDDGLSRVRGQEIGFVFQAFNLISELSILENVEVPMFYQGIRPRERTVRAREALEKVGLGDRCEHKPSELSGGQQQRTAIARALVGNPSILMADEPTGNLDSVTGRSILEIFDQLHASGLTLIIVTHDQHTADRCDRLITLHDGRISEDMIR